MCAPVALPDIAAKQFEIKQHLVTMVQWNQFGGSLSEDIIMHLHTFTELCDVTRTKDYEPDALKLHLFFR